MRQDRKNQNVVTEGFFPDREIPVEDEEQQGNKTRDGDDTGKKQKPFLFVLLLPPSNDLW